MRSPGIHFSSRFHWDSRPNALTALLAEKRRAQRNGSPPLLDLTESNPTHAEFAYPKEEILAALSDTRALRYDPDPRGMLVAREAVSRYYAGRGVDVDPSRIILTASTSEAYSYLFKLLTDPGDSVLVPRPSYPLFEYLAAMESVQVRQYPLRYDGSWHIDFPSLDSAAGPDAARVRAIVIVNPNNPTGSYLKRDEWTRLAAWAMERGLAILSDEVFSDFALTPDRERIATLAAAEEAPVFAISGLSKTAGLPQMKLGWIVASGAGNRAALDGLEWIADTYLSVATPVQLALDRLLDSTESVRDQIRARTAGNLTAASTAFSTGTGENGVVSTCRVLNVEGGWNVVIQVPRTRSEEEWALGLLRDADVLVQPGFFYDFESEAYLVASLLTEPVVFKEGIRRLGRYAEG